MKSAPQEPRVILLAEDDPADRMILERALEQSSFDARLYAVNDGAQALDYLKRGGAYTDPVDSPRPDLVLVDLNMPRVDGLQVIRELRGDERFKALPIVALTTSSDEHDVRQAYALGANSYIVKPTGMSELMQAVEALQQYWFALVELPPAA